MPTSIELKKGFEILEPFLKLHSFELECYEYGFGIGEEFTIGTYKNGEKRFIVSLLSQIGEVTYQYKDLKVYHQYYLEILGLGVKKKFLDFNTYNRPDAFNNILFDFEFLVEDFFNGSCKKMQEIASLQGDIISDYNVSSHEEFSIKFDKIRIETARKAFVDKNFKNTGGIYKKVENKNLLNELDRNIIEYCERHLLESQGLLKDSI